MSFGKPILILSFMLLVSVDALAVTCESVFSNAVGTTGDKLDVKKTASLLNTGNRVLATSKLDNDGGSSQCDGSICIESGTYAPLLALPANASKLVMKGGALVFSPGDYYFEKLEVKEGGSITLTGSGQVRIHVRKGLKFEKDAQINVNGNPLDLVFLVGERAEIKDDAQVKAIVYAKREVKVNDDAQVEGALVGDKATIGGRASVTYSSTATLAIDSVCSAAQPPLDHIRLNHDGAGAAGVPETVTILACANADCSQRYSGAVTVALTPVDANTSWSGSGVSGNQTTFSGGQKVVALNRMSAGTFTIGSSATPSPQNPTRCFIGASETCSITFSSTAFSVALHDQVSAMTAAGSVSPSSCWSDFQSRTVQVNVAVQYVSPVWVGPAASANGTVLPTDGSSATVSLAFDANCVAPLQVDYADAGQLGVSVEFVGAGALSGLRMDGSDNLVFYPAALNMQVTNASAATLNATSAGGLPVHTAGANFNLSVMAVNSSGGTTLGYRPQASDRLRAYVQRTGPVSGFEGTLNLTSTTSLATQPNPPATVADYADTKIAPGDFVNGLFTNSQAAYSEVGLIRLYLLDADYLGHSIMATPLSIGRFVPAGFHAFGTLTNRSSTPGCAGGTFSYLGESLQLAATLSAHNLAGEVTRNYQAGFAPFTGSGFSAYSGSAGNTVGARSGSADLSSRLSLNSASLSVPWAAGMATLVFDLDLQAASSVDGPFDATALGLAFTDADGVSLQGLDLDVDSSAGVDHRNVGSTSFRAGRLAFANAHGSELRDLNVPLAMQYYAGSTTGFTTHTLDNCTPIASTLLTDVDGSDALSVTDTCIVDQLGASGANACPSGTTGLQYNNTAAAGRFVVSLKSPGQNKTGAVRLTADAPVWAEYDWSGAGEADPSGVATFGIYNRSTDFIYLRELR